MTVPYVFASDTGQIPLAQLDSNFAYLLGATLSSIAALRLRLKSDNPTVFVTGYYAAGDGGGGSYYYDASDTSSADNGGTIIVAADGGRWKLTQPGVISAKQFGAKGDGVTDDTTSLSAWELYCRSAARVMYAPASTYLCGNWNFGSNTVGSQSTAAPEMFGDGLATIFKAKPGTTGVLIPSVNISGVALRDFMIDCDSKAASGIDTSWYATGPSLYNRYERVLIQNYNGGPGWIGTNNNDCDFESCHVRLPQGGATVAFSIKATGGLVHMSNCIWSDAVLYLGAQNYVLTGCWGHGILYASAAVNDGVINGGYIYSNATSGSAFRTEALTSGTKIGSITLNGTWIDLANGARTAFKVRAAGKIILNSCVVVPVAGVPQLLDAACVADVGMVFVEFNGGRVESGGTLGTTYPANFVVVKNNLDNNGTVENTTSGSYTPALKFGGNNAGMTTSNAVARFSITDGFLHEEGLIVLTNKGGSVGGATITGLPFARNAVAPDSVILVLYQNVTYAAGTPVGFMGTGAQAITLYQQASGTGVTQLTDAAFANNSEVRWSGKYPL